MAEKAREASWVPVSPGPRKVYVVVPVSFIHYLVRPKWYYLVVPSVGASIYDLGTHLK